MPTSKAIFVIIAVQTALLLFMSYRVMSLETRTSELTAQIGAQSTRSSTSDATSADRAPPFTVPALSADATRKIVREEIDLLSERLVEILEQSEKPRAPFTNQSSKRSLSTPGATITPEEVAQLSTSVSAQLSALSAQGTASPTELAKLELTMVKLPPEQRMKAFAELNRAINEGRIKARF